MKKLTSRTLQISPQIHSGTPGDDDLILSVAHHACKDNACRPIYVFRLLYDGVPRASYINNAKKHNERLPLVLLIYEWLAARVHILSGSTIFTDFNMVIFFFRYCDTTLRMAELTESTVSSYAQHISNQVNNNAKSHACIRGMSDRFSAFLSWAGYEALANLMPKVARHNVMEKKTQAYSDEEQIGVSRDLFRVFNVLASRLKKGQPITCPFDQPKTNWDISSYNSTLWFNKLTITALFLTANFTGDNNSPLRKLRRRDVTEREFHFDKTINLYRLVSKKDRQGGQENTWDMGFTRRGKNFFSVYLNCLEYFNLPEEAYLFPRFDNGQYDGFVFSADITSYINWFMARAPHQVRPVIGRFRQSKSDGLMADTNSIATVAEGLNNLKGTAARHYMNGNPHNNRNRLGSAAEALELTARGASINEARKVVEAKYGRPLRAMEIIAKGDAEPAPTKMGSRCRQPFGDKAQSLKRELVASGLLAQDESIACFKFLDCFGCEFQALVAEVDDIWCMLSFRESLTESLQRPAINHHLPVTRINDVMGKIQIMLAEVERDYPDVYAKAIGKLNVQAHPLWDDENSVADLYDIW
ncbi:MULTISPECIES: hypothetical protein [Enterobacteriaceae]|mgnify:CR=1 FL=1|uniref:hypothetical protein n=1 Tax=Enterobacteriaceae TaxID=543 RepID=UPI00026113E4|nr:MULTISPECIES: hypothetical protein [Enterobacteriaceae]AIX60714.1 hypothetical protein ECNIH5_18930 [Enterobacter cloacae]EAA9032985.1 hypothetical protein [Salmonella enterica]EAR2361328.1 hypothetical protein [Salmonella enterica subsp. enterica serovar Senftenberg]EIV6807856.1 hypothetical protein [Klebsiella pneumoniae]VAL45315.1 Uncharacterised protein [Enterobacter kobei]HCJ6304827.1 hypothetical protein [Enterobacter hormaechei subsp. xiangfangensis]HCW3121331.1 hypothetical protei